MIRSNVTYAIMARNFRSYFSGILGYLFIVVFCVATAHYAFSPQFFTDNQANLSQLTKVFPSLLLFLIPAITMTVWSDEKKLGTDELLFTLPATEMEIVLGKFKAVVGVYTIALLFSVVNAVVLVKLGSPDIGMLFSTYLGYWLSGVALLSAGMLASALTGIPTVAFVLGVIFCCIPVLIANVMDVVEFVFSSEDLNKAFEFIGTTTDSFRSTLTSLSLQSQLEDFATGVIPVYNLLFLAAFILLMLYLNYVVISKRRWATKSISQASHHFVRWASLLIGSTALLVLVSRMTALPLRADMTSESIYSLSNATESTLSKISDSDEVVVQAFLSPEVPRDYADTKRQLIGLLKEFQAAGNGKFQYREVNVKPFSDAEEEARALGITPRRVVYEQDDGRVEEAEIFMGIEIRSSNDEIVIPFIDKGIPVEYELTRSIATVLREERKKIGILQTDAQLLPTQTSFMDNAPEWEIVRELRKQFEVVSVNPDNEIKAIEKRDGKDDKINFDVLLAVAPSSLTQPQMNNFLAYVKSGSPVLIFDDPLTVSFPFQRRGGISQAPTLPKPTDQSASMFGGRPPQPPPKAENGKLTELQNILKVKWRNDRIVYDRDNPHSQFAALQEEIAFLSRRRTGTEIFGSDSPITRELQEVVAMFSGSIEVLRKPEKAKKWPQVTRLLTTGPNSGFLNVQSNNAISGDEEPLQATLYIQRDFEEGAVFKLNGEEDSKADGYENRGDTDITLGKDEGSFRDDFRFSFVVASPGRLSRFATEPLKIGVDVDWVSNTEIKLNRRLKTGEVLLAVKDMRVDNVATLGRTNPFSPQQSLIMKRDEEIVRRDDEYAHTIAVHVMDESEDNPLNAIFISDIDMIGDQFFQIRSTGNLEIQFDNVTFVLNAIDVLAQEDAFIDLRSRRDKNRTLTYVESLTSGLRRELARAERLAEKAKDDKLEKAQFKLDEQVKEIQQSKDLDDQSKAIKVEQKREQLQRDLNIQTERLERQVNDSKRVAARKARGKIRGIQNSVRLFAYFAVAVLPICFGLLFLGTRQAAEKSLITPERRR